MAALLERGALPFAELARSARLSKGALAWHLHSMAREGLVLPRDGGAYALCDRSAAAMAVALHREAPAAALEDAAREIFDDPR
jgi:DNA-binding IclR family transcriptional regulator